MRRYEEISKERLALDPASSAPSPSPDTGIPTPATEIAKHRKRTGISCLVGLADPVFSLDLCMVVD